MDSDQYGEERARILGEMDEQEDNQIIGDDLMDMFDQDMAELGSGDEYEAEGINDDEQVQATREQLREAEQVMAERRRREIQVTNRRMPEALRAMFDTIDQEGGPVEGTAKPTTRLVRRAMAQVQDGDGPSQSDVPMTDTAKDEGPMHEQVAMFSARLANVKGRASTFAAQEDVQEAIYHLFIFFLEEYKDLSGEAHYVRAAQTMIARDGTSFEVVLGHMLDDQALFDQPDVQMSVFQAFQPLLHLLLQAARVVIPVINIAASDFVAKITPLYLMTHPLIRARLTWTNIGDKQRHRMSELRRDLVDTMVCVEGIVTRRTELVPCLLKVSFECTNCGAVSEDQQVTNREKVMPPRQCASCNARSRFKVHQATSIYENYRRVSISEPPNKVPPGRMPLAFDVVLTDDLVDSCRPGDLITAMGVFTVKYDTMTNRKAGVPVLYSYIEANNIMRERETQDTLENEEEIMRLLKTQGSIDVRLINSIARAIHGSTPAKTALACALFSGGATDDPKIRNDCHVLMVGDPGMAKSQMLLFSMRVAPRPIYTNGKSASAVGLTAAVKRDPMSGEMTLQAGAMVLADQGVCLIDEFDKMTDRDRTALHESMEQQSISISKAGINTTLAARATVIAAGNPIKGRYDENLSLEDNVDLSDPILSRFDLIVVMKDRYDPDEDARLARFLAARRSTAREISTETMAADEDEEEELTIEALRDPSRPLPTAVLKAYIARARRLRPRIEGAVQYAPQIYAEVRGACKSMGLSFNPRQFEAIPRISKAHARMRLDERVTEADFKFAVRVVLSSFIDRQKIALRGQLRQALHKFIVDETDIRMTVAEHLKSFALLQLRIKRNSTGTMVNEVRFTLALFEATYSGLSKDYYSTVRQVFSDAAFLDECGFEIDDTPGVRHGLIKRYDTGNM